MQWETVQNGFFVAQTTMKRHETKNKQQRSINKKSSKNNRKMKYNKKIKNRLEWILVYSNYC